MTHYGSLRIAGTAATPSLTFIQSPPATPLEMLALAVGAAALVQQPIFIGVQSRAISGPRAVARVPLGRIVANESPNELPKLPGALQSALDLIESALPKDLRISFDALPEPVQPWVQSYTAQPKLFWSDFAGIVLFATVGRLTHLENVLNPFGDLWTALPFLLGYYAAAHPFGAAPIPAPPRPPHPPPAAPPTPPLPPPPARTPPSPGAYEKGAVTSSYCSMVSSLAPAWAAGAFGGIVLNSLGHLELPSVLDFIGTLLSTFVFLGGARGVIIFQDSSDGLDRVSPGRA